MPIVDIHTHCAPRSREDPLGVAEALRGTPVGRNAVTNYRGLPAVSYHDMYDFDLQQEVCARAGITARIISNPFAAEVMAAVSKKPGIDVVKHVNDQNAAIVARSSKNFGLGTLNRLDASHVAEGERCLKSLGFKGLLITSSWHGRFIDGEDTFAFWEWAQDREVPIFIHPPRAPIGHAQQMDQYKLDELVGRPFDTAMALARMILSGPRHAALGEGRHGGELRQPLRAGERERAYIAALDLLADQPRQWRDAQVDAIGQKLGEHRREPLERHVQHVDRRLGLEQLARQMGAGAVAHRAEGEAAGLGLRQRDEIGEAGRGQALAHHQHVRHGGDAGDRDEVAHGVVRTVLDQALVGRVGLVGAEDEHVAVGLGARHRAGADDARAAGAVLNHID
jgi:hypothetical protein